MPGQTRRAELGSLEAESWKLEPGGQAVGGKTWQCPDPHLVTCRRLCVLWRSIPTQVVGEHSSCPGTVHGLPAKARRAPSRLRDVPLPPLAPFTRDQGLMEPHTEPWQCSRDGPVQNGQSRQACSSAVDRHYWRTSVPYLSAHGQQGHAHAACAARPNTAGSNDSRRALMARGAWRRCWAAAICLVYPPGVLVTFSWWWWAMRAIHGHTTSTGAREKRTIRKGQADSTRGQKDRPITTGGAASKPCCVSIRLLV
jgi:hypothetical protein